MIENASLPQQREQRSTLMQLCEDAAQFKLRSPAILVIGDVAGQAASSSALLQIPA
ncbi:uroporphyrin-III C-methyltransferase [compost metagenome]